MNSTVKLDVRRIEVLQTFFNFIALPVFGHTIFTHSSASQSAVPETVLDIFTKRCLRCERRTRDGELLFDYHNKEKQKRKIKFRLCFCSFDFIYVVSAISHELCAVRRRALAMNDVINFPFSLSPIVPFSRILTEKRDAYDAIELLKLIGRHQIVGKQSSAEHRPFSPSSSTTSLSTMSSFSSNNQQ